MSLSTPREWGVAARALKRSMDILLSTLGLLLLTPLFLVVAVLIKLDSRGSVFFREPRVGRAGCEFSLVKFRTMHHDAEKREPNAAHLTRHAAMETRVFETVDDPRVTRAGHFLRRTSVDELPQLFNVLLGQMSLVGPRPLVPDETGQAQGQPVPLPPLRPGMTGPWRRLDRDEIPLDEERRLDDFYAGNWSPWSDLRLLVGAVLGARKPG